MSKKTVVKTKKTEVSEEVDSMESSDERKLVAGSPPSDDLTSDELDFAEKPEAEEELTPTFLKPAPVAVAVQVAPVEPVAAPVVPRKKVGPYGGEVLTEAVDGYVWVKLPAHRILKMQAKGECRGLAASAAGPYEACEVPVSSLVEE